MSASAGGDTHSLPANAGAASDIEQTSGYQWLLVALLSTNYGIVFFDRNALNFLMPFIQPELGLSGTQIGLIASALSLSWSIAAYWLGQASDRYGNRKTILVIATIIFSLMSVATGFAGSFGALLAARLLMGAAEGGVLPISLAMISGAVSDRVRGLAMGITQNLGSSLLGTFVAPIVLVALASHFGWRYAFVIAAIPGLIMAFLIWKYVKPDLAEAAKNAPASGLTFRGALRHRNLVLCGLIAILAVSFFLVTMVFMPLYLVQMKNFSPSDMGWLIAVLGIASTVNSIALSALADRIGRKAVMVLGAALGLLLPVAVLTPDLSFPTIALLFALGWSPISLFPLFMGAIPSETVPPHHSGTAIGLVMALGESVGGVFSPALTGILTDQFGLEVILWLLMGLVALIVSASLFLRETAPRLRAKRPQ